MPPHWANAHGGLVVRPRVGEATPPHPYKPLGLLAGVRPNPPPFGVLVRVMVLRLTCITPKVTTWDIISISINPQLILSHVVLLMQSS